MHMPSPHRKWFERSGKTGEAIVRTRAHIYNKSAKHHQTIIPTTTAHGALILGAIPTITQLGKISVENGGRPITRISLLASDEEGAMGYGDDPIHIELFDHSVLDPSTGKNISIDKMQEHIQAIFEQTQNPESVLYCHCMAGHSRSFTTVLSLLYSHPELLTDSNLKPKGTYPSLKEISVFVERIRPVVKGIDEKKAPQQGFLGLMALDTATKRLEKMNTITPETFKSTAQDIAFMLHSSLDRGFRKISDVKKQEQNFAQLYALYQKNGRNLLLDMFSTTKSTDAGKNFDELSLAQQAHFAILTKKLEATHKKLELPLGYSPLKCATKAMEKPEELTTGDQIELLRAFGDALFAKEDIIYIAERLMSGSKTDRHHNTTQLAELLGLAKDKNIPGIGRDILDIVGLLNKNKQTEFHEALVAYETASSITHTPSPRQEP
jgi:hypothetical protein